MSERKSSKAKIAAVGRYNAKNTVQVPLRFNNNTDADIVEHLGSLTESKLGYIKRLIREDIARER